VLVRLLLAVLLAALAAPALADARPPRPDSYVLPAPTLFPEGVAYDEHSGRYFVSSQSNGALLTGELREPAARLLSEPGADGRTSANGLDTDRRGRLWVATGQLARLYVQDASDGSLIRWFALGAGSYANDVGVTRRHGVFVADSLKPILWRVDPRAATPGAPGQAEPWLDLTTTPIQYAAGFNLNGIEVTANDRYLLAVQSNTGQLWRIDTRTKGVREVDLRGARLTAGDGLVLRGHTLWAVQNSLGQIAKVRLGRRFRSGAVVGTTTDPSFRFPTTADIARGRMLVVNSQFDRRTAMQPPDLPFRLSSIPVP
jgi:Cu-Zn family superoxide dismutase